VGLVTGSSYFFEHGGQSEVSIQILTCLDVRILPDIRGIDSPLEALIETEGHHAA
jgi:hypothetical protein